MICMPLCLILNYEIPSASGSLNTIEIEFASKSSKASSSSSASVRSSACAGFNNVINTNTIFLAFIGSFSL